MSSWSPWEDASYCWVVVCKNKPFHRQAGVDLGHKIPLGETDSFSTKPAISAPFLVRCPDCREEYSYNPDEIQRVELNLVDSFTAHPLFRESIETEHSSEHLASPSPPPHRSNPPRWWPWKRQS